MPQKRDKTTGLPLPNPVVPGSTICYSMQIPNAPEYRQALRGVLSELGKAYNWSQTDGQSDVDAQDAAQLWRVALNTGVYSDDCETDMSCDDVADCIETSDAVKEAIAQQIANNPSNQTTVYETSVYGAPLTPAQRSAPIATPPDCDLDVLFAMCTAIIDQIHTNNQDFLEILEAASNPTERARNVISAIPVVGLLPIDEAIEFIDQLVEEIQENYDAQWTTSIRDELRCALFCKAQNEPDCIVTFDMIVSIFEDRLNYYLDPAATAAALVQYFLLSTWAGTTVVDIMSLIQVAFWREASNWLGVNIRTLQIVARLVIDNPDPDWQTLPCECADVPLPIQIYNVAGYASGSFVKTGEGEATFTASLGTDGAYRVFFVFTNAEKAARLTYLSSSVTFAPGYQGYYPQGQDILTNGYLVGGVGAAPTTGNCYNAITFTHSSPFTVDIIFTEDC